MRPDELPSTPGAGGAPRRWRSTRRCRTLSSNGWEYPPSQTNLNPSNRPVRTRMPGGVAGDADNLRAPMPIALFFWRRVRSDAKLGRNMPREREGVSASVRIGEAPLMPSPHRPGEGQDPYVDGPRGTRAL